MSHGPRAARSRVLSARLRIASTRGPRTTWMSPFNNVSVDILAHFFTLEVFVDRKLSHQWLLLPQVITAPTMYHITTHVLFWVVVYCGVMWCALKPLSPFRMLMLYAGSIKCWRFRSQRSVFLL